MNYYSRYRRILEVKAMDKARKQYAASHRVMAELDRFIEDFKSTHEDFGLRHFKHFSLQHYSYQKHISEFCKLIVSVQQREDLMPVKKAQFKEMIKEYNLMMKEELFSDREVNFPHNMGWGFIGKGEARYDDLKINWKETNARKKMIYHLNEHTDGYWFGMRWERPRNVPFMRFLLTKLVRDELSQCIRDGLRFSRYYSAYSMASQGFRKPRQQKRDAIHQRPDSYSPVVPEDTFG
jgi:hypothetical protein